MNPKNAKEYLEQLFNDTREYYENCERGAYTPLFNNVVFKCEKSFYGNVLVDISSNYAYAFQTISRYNQLDYLFQVFMQRSFYNFYKKFYLANRK